jgi:TolA-binding protein
VRRAVLLAFAITAVACGQPTRGATYASSFAAGERAQGAGRYEEAAALYDRAADGAKVPRDQQHARYLAARMLSRAGNARDAAVRLRRIADATPPTEDSAAAAYHLTELTIATGHEAEGMQQLEAFILRFPSSGIARHALLRLIRHDSDTAGKQAALDHLRRLQPKLDATELGETVAYQIALAIGDLGDAAASRDALLAVARRWPYPRGDFWDNALFRASEIDERLGRYPEAIAHLEAMLAERETSDMLGTYQRPLYTPALLRIGALYRDRLHDRARARQAFHRVYTDFTSSVMRDDALYEEATLFQEEGNAPAACERLRTLTHDFPDSRYVPCATTQCSSIERPAQSRAPKDCRDYIKRAPRLGTPAPPDAP